MKEYRGKWMRRFLRSVLTICALCVMPAVSASAKDLVIVLDPGHGGPETGVHREWDGVEYKEELLTLKIAKYAKQELEKYDGVKVYLTRSSNNVDEMNREERIKYAKSVNATALVSIHLNSTADLETAQTGAMAYVPSTANYPNTNKYAKRSRLLGKAILQELNAQTGLKNRGYGYDDELGIILFGMKYKIPSLIVEHCFVNNPDDCKQHLRTAAQLKALGVADATGIARTCGLKLKNGQQTTPAEPVVTTGWQEENGVRCYYVSGTKVKNKWQKIDGKYYYFDSTGALKTGVFKIGNKAYLSDASGVRQSGLVKYGKRLYLASNQGRLYTGWRDINGKRYYFSPKTYGAYGGLKKINGKGYYFSTTTFAMQKGWVGTLYGAKRFFNKKTGVMLRNCWVKTKKKWYYMGSNGVAYQNTKKTINGKVYIFNARGVCTNH